MSSFEETEAARIGMENVSMNESPSSTGDITPCTENTVSSKESSTMTLESLHTKFDAFSEKMLLRLDIIEQKVEDRRGFCSSAMKANSSW
jgi:hypothetical protein